MIHWPALVLGFPLVSAVQEGSRLEEVARLPAGRSPGSVEVFDFNLDGKLDVVVANEESANVSVFLGDGKGKLAPSAGSPFSSGPNPNDIAIADFNGDRLPDLAIANHESTSLTVLLGDGRGGFAASPGSPIRVSSRPHPHGVAAADLNGDGHLDLATESWEEDQVILVYGNGRGEFPGKQRALSVGRHPYQRLRLADVNGDGRADVLTTNLRGNDLTVLLGDGSGAFLPSKGSPFPCNSAPFALSIADLNRDGLLDVAVANSPSNSLGTGEDGLTVLLGDGRGGFRRTADRPAPTGRAPGRLAAGDIDGDGRVDVAVTNLNSDTVSIAVLDRVGGIAAVSSHQVGRQPKGIALGELDGDGRLELVVALAGEDAVSILTHRGELPGAR